MQHHVGCLDKILRTLLHGDAPEKGHHLLLVGVVGSRYSLMVLAQGVDGIVHGEHLSRVLMILVDHRGACQLAHAHDAIGMVHAVFLDGIYRGVHPSATAVIIGGVHVNAQRLAAHLLGMYAGRVGQPVVGMDDVKLLGPRHHAGNDRIVVDLFVQIAGIASREIHTPQVIDLHIVEIGVYMRPIPIVFVGIHDVSHARLHIVVVHVSVHNGYAIHRHDARVGMVFVSPRLGKTEYGLHVALRVQSLGDAEIGGGKSSVHMGRILPSKH